MPARAGNHKIRVAVPDSSSVYTVTTLAGGGTTGNSYGQVDGSGSAALFKYPAGIAVGSGGLVFVSDSANHKIRVVDSSSGAVTTLVGGGAAGNSYGSADGFGTSALLTLPTGLALLDVAPGYVANTLLLADYQNNKVRSGRCPSHRFYAVR